MSPRSAARRRRSALAVPRRALTLSDDWRAWVVDNLLAGVTRQDLIATLVAERVPRHIARAEVDAIAASPSLHACQRMNERVRQLEMVISLRRSLAGLAPHAAEVERRTRVSADEFFEHYYSVQKPVILTDVVPSWPAFGRWNPEYFKQTLGHIDIAIVSGRDGDPDCDRNFDRHRETTTMAAYVDRIMAAGTSNDIYMIAHNRNMERAELAPLFDDIVADPDIFDPGQLRGGVTLWFGPAGTITPLHHDPTSILFCQVYGSKRVVLIAPWELSLLDRARGYYSALDMEDPDILAALTRAGVTVLDIELRAGEALFIPVGFWHHVKALQTSITFSLLNFRRRNSFDWYKPGLVAK